MDNDPDAPRGKSELEVWFRFCCLQRFDLYFGDGYRVEFTTPNRPCFYIYIFEGDWIGRVPTDGWDRVSFRNRSDFYLSFEYLGMLHSDYRILDRSFSLQVLADAGDPAGQISLFRDICNTKLETMYTHAGGFLRERYLADHPVVSNGAEEIGKTDGYKYAGHNRAWCSEFASWLLRNAGLATPSGYIDVDDMQDWFRSHGVLRVGTTGISMHTGTYLNINGGTHSAIFLEYVEEDPDLGNLDTLVRTIEGNYGGQVSLVVRPLREITAIGYVP